MPTETQRWSYEVLLDHIEMWAIEQMPREWGVPSTESRDQTVFALCQVFDEMVIPKDHLTKAKERLEEVMRRALTRKGGSTAVTHETLHNSLDRLKLREDKSLHFPSRASIGEITPETR